MSASVLSSIAFAAVGRARALARLAPMPSASGLATIAIKRIKTT